MSALVKVDFHGDTVLAERRDERTVVVMLKPMVENLGIDWRGQLQRIKRDPVLGPSVCMIHTETPAGAREAVGLPLNLIPGFLFGIDSARISEPEIRATVIAYQRECHEVLFRHFFVRPERADPTEDWDWELVGRKLAFCKEVRATFGAKRAARQMVAFGLVEAEAIEPARTGGAVDNLPFVQQFLDECTSEDAQGFVQAREMSRRYNQWAARNEAPQLKERALAICLDALDIRKSRGRLHTYLGIRLKHISELMA